MATGQVHGSAVAGYELAEVRGWWVRGVVFFQLPQDSTQVAVHYEGEEVGKKLDNQLSILDMIAGGNMMKEQFSSWLSRPIQK